MATHSSVLVWRIPGMGEVKVKSLSRVRLLVTPWTAAYQAPPSMGFSRQVYWSGVPLPSPMNPLNGSQLHCDENASFKVLHSLGPACLLLQSYLGPFTHLLPR